MLTSNVCILKRMKHKISILLFLIAILISCFYTVNATVLSGTLKDTDGNELPDTTIYLADENGNNIEDSNTESDENGHFEFDLDTIDGISNVDENQVRREYINNKFSFNVEGHDSNKIEINNYNYSPKNNVEIVLAYPSNDENALNKMIYIKEQYDYIYRKFSNGYSCDIHLLPYNDETNSILDTAAESMTTLKQENLNYSTIRIVYMYVTKGKSIDVKKTMVEYSALTAPTTMSFVLIPDEQETYNELQSMAFSLPRNEINFPNKTYKRFDIRSFDENLKDIIDKTRTINGTIFEYNALDLEEVDNIEIGDPHDNFATEDMIVTVDADGTTPPGDGTDTTLIKPSDIEINTELECRVYLADGRDITDAVYDITPQMKCINVDKELMQGMTVQVEGKLSVYNNRDTDDEDVEDEITINIDSNLFNMKYDKNCELLSKDAKNEEENWDGLENVAVQKEKIKFKGHDSIYKSIAMSQLITSGIDPEYKIQFRIYDKNNNYVDSSDILKLIVTPPTGGKMCMFPNMLNKMYLSKI